jgi:integrase
MPKIKLTKDAIRKLPAPHPAPPGKPPGTQVLYWDQDLKGFGVLVSGTTSAKSFVVQREVNGKSRRVTLQTWAEFEASDRTIENIRTEASELLTKMRKGFDPKVGRGPTANVTLRERLNGNDWLGKWLGNWLDRPLRDITPQMVEKRHREIKEEVAKRNHRVTGFSSDPGAAAANGVMRALRKIWNDALHEVPELPANPVAILKERKLWYPVPERERYVTGDQLPKFYKAVTELSSQTMRDYILLVLFTGLRREEAAGLRWADIDFAQRFIRVPSWRTKNRRVLNLPMADYVNNLLIARRALGYENAYVFPGNSASGHLQEPKKAMQDVGKASGVNVSVHDLRRTFITVAARCSIPPMVLQGLVNHSTGRGITAGYARLSDADLVEPMQIVTDRIKALCGIPAVLGDGVVPIRA